MITSPKAPSLRRSDQRRKYSIEKSTLTAVCTQQFLGSKRDSFSEVVAVPKFSHSKKPRCQHFHLRHQYGTCFSWARYLVSVRRRGSVHLSFCVATTQWELIYRQWSYYVASFIFLHRVNFERIHSAYLIYCCFPWIRNNYVCVHLFAASQLCTSTHPCLSAVLLQLLSCYLK